MPLCFFSGAVVTWRGWGGGGGGQGPRLRLGTTGHAKSGLPTLTNVGLRSCVDSAMVHGAACAASHLGVAPHLTPPARRRWCAAELQLVQQPRHQLLRCQLEPAPPLLLRGLLGARLAQHDPGQVGADVGACLPSVRARAVQEFTGSARAPAWARDRGHRPCRQLARMRRRRQVPNARTCMHVGALACTPRARARVAIAAAACIGIRHPSNLPAAAPAAASASWRPAATLPAPKCAPAACRARACCRLKVTVPNQWP